MDIRKNLDKLIKAFALVYRNNKNIKLVITGDNKRIKGQLDTMIADLGLGNSVVFTGYVNDRILGAIIKSATLICYPTLSEGFGFPVLEGFAAGVPVISSNTSSLPEVAGKAALLINPKKVNEIAGAIEKVLHGGKSINEMVLKGKARYNMFNWKESVNEYLDLYNSI
jgi:glycosyltransferase involved in cell wall biosynthesis